MAERQSGLELEQIKLAGFKSFVEPVAVKLPGNLAAIVGPNGCGKSNIIDAVRWVMGESSAKNLRGESMADVIFNGSTDRKPLGQASVELVFNNPHGACGGEYAEYEKISIRRVVTRDGQSNYYLNNARCRRRDIIDIFLGTGLGPRSYAIVGQGDISRIIEARPEELRVYLEEAAGISKYKERRRETENSIRHTRENLERLSDIREELDKQLNHLRRQSESAEKYKILKDQERTLKAQLLALRWLNLETSINQVETRRRTFEVDLEAATSEQQHFATEIDKQRIAFTSMNDGLNQIQEKYYDAGAQVARFEQSIQHQKERQIQLQQDIADSDQNLQSQQQQWQETSERLDIIKAELAETEPTLEALKKSEKLAAEVFAAAEEDRQCWQQRWDEFSSASAKANQEAQVQQTRIQHNEQTTEKAKQKIIQLEQEQDRYEDSDLQKQVEILRQETTQLEEEQHDAKQQLELTVGSIKQQRESIQQHQHELDDIRNNLQQAHGRQASLQALQQAALDQQSGDALLWLEKHGLDSQQRLAQILQVEPGWERASEVVLGDSLQAVCIDNLDPLANILSELNKGELNFFVTSHHGSLPRQSGMTPLREKITSDCAIGDLLDGVYVAEDIATALSQRDQLASHESIVTKDGIWLSQNWLRVVKEADQESGILHREKSLNELVMQIETLNSRRELLENEFEMAQDQLLILEERRDEQQQQVNQFSRTLSDKKAQLRIRENRIEQFHQRLDQLHQEADEQQKIILESRESLEEARTIWQKAMVTLEQDVQRRESLGSEKVILQEKFTQSREKSHDLRDQLQALLMAHNRLTTEQETKQAFQSTMGQQIAALQQRTLQLNDAYEQCVAPIETLQEELEGALEKRLTLETQVTEARTQVQSIEQQLSELENKRKNTETAVLEKREALEKINLDHQGSIVRRSTVLEQLEEENQPLQPLLETMPEDADEKQWELQIQQVGNRIQRLGAINLAAIDEFDTQSERKIYLDKQNDDLVESLDVLEKAIGKIDEETRERFKETYDFVNERFKSLFPKVFNGGSACLELTGEDLLDTGVAVMARPPGKRNSTIHLLSGGEKALTAIALVFSIFHLKPAPFCLLDEVDAPLDDSNVIRFCSLLKEMAKEVQFLYISHNKIAIEMADHLIGVTMREAGVSRLVSVDIDAAMEMAEA